MKYVYTDTTLIMVVGDENATIRTKNNVAEFETHEEAIAFLSENGIDYTILLNSEET